MLVFKSQVCLAIMVETTSNPNVWTLSKRAKNQLMARHLVLGFATEGEFAATGIFAWHAHMSGPATHSLANTTAFGMTNAHGIIALAARTSHFHGNTLLLHASFLGHTTSSLGQTLKGHAGSTAAGAGGLGSCLDHFGFFSSLKFFIIAPYFFLVS